MIIQTKLLIDIKDKLIVQLSFSSFCFVFLLETAPTNQFTKKYTTN